MAEESKCPDCPQSGAEHRSPKHRSPKHRPPKHRPGLWLDAPEPTGDSRPTLFSGHKIKSPSFLSYQMANLHRPHRESPRVGTPAPPNDLPITETCIPCPMTNPWSDAHTCIDQPGVIRWRYRYGHRHAFPEISGCHSSSHPGGDASYGGREAAGVAIRRPRGIHSGPPHSTDAGFPTGHGHYHCP